MYTMRMYCDTLKANAKMELIVAQQSFFYVLSGKAVINGWEVPAGNAHCQETFIDVEAKEEDTVIWRYELERTEEPLHIGKGEHVESQVKMVHRVRMFELAPTARYLLRVDRITQGTGCTGWHCNVGSGIRTLLTGGMTVESDLGENSVNKGLGATWYEEGCYPMRDTYMDFEEGSFVRFMVFPTNFEIKGDPITDPMSQGITWITGRNSTGYWEVLKEKAVTLI